MAEKLTERQEILLKEALRNGGKRICPMHELSADELESVSGGASNSEKIMCDIPGQFFCNMRPYDNVCTCNKKNSHTCCFDLNDKCWDYGNEKCIAYEWGFFL